MTITPITKTTPLATNASSEASPNITELGSEILTEVFAYLNAGTLSKAKPTATFMRDAIDALAEDTLSHINKHSGSLQLQRTDDSVHPVQLDLNTRRARAKDAATSLPALIDLAHDDPDWLVRDKALGTLSAIHPPTAEITEAIITASQQDPDWMVRTTAIEALAATTPTDNVIEALTNVKATDADASLRWAAGQTLSALMETSESIAEILGRLSEKSPSPSVRKGAVEKLAEIALPKDHTMQALMHAAEYDQDREVRIAAIEALYTLIEHNAAIPQALIRVLENDTDSAARMTAAWALSSIKHPPESVINALFDVAQHDNDVIVREAAIKQLSRLPLAQINHLANGSPTLWANVLLPQLQNSLINKLGEFAETNPQNIKSRMHLETEAHALCTSAHNLHNAKYYPTLAGLICLTDAMARLAGKPDQQLSALLLRIATAYAASQSVNRVLTGENQGTELAMTPFVAAAEIFLLSVILSKLMSS